MFTENNLTTNNNMEDENIGERFNAPRKKPFFKKPIVIAVSAIILTVAIGGFVFYKVTKQPIYNYTAVKKGTIIQEVSVTGRVKPAQSVDLAFETGGKVGKVYVKVGTKVKRDQSLISLANGEYTSKLLQAQADLAVQQATLFEYKKGTRPEEIKQAETKVNNAKKTLADKQTNLTNVKNKADADFKEDYNAALTALQDAIIKGKNALFTLSDLQFKYFISSGQDDIDIADAKKDAVEALLGEKNAGSLATEELSKLTGGAFGDTQFAVNNFTYSNVDKALTNGLDALQKVKLALGEVPLKSTFTSTEKSSLSTEKTTITASITTVTTKQQAISVQKSTNKSNIATAEAAVNTAKSTLANEQNNLALKKAGYTSEQISAQDAKVKSAQANVQNIQAQIAKRIITAPIAGIVTKQDAKLGEIVSANINLVSLISESENEVEVYIPEVDISKVSVGDSADITLDAYGNNVKFGASVVSINPAETMIEGVATYKTVLQFSKGDSRIKSGMTANIDIKTDKKENVLYVPVRVVFTKNGKKYVKILIEETTREIEVKTGIRDSEGNIEIKSGLKEGEKVVI